VEDRARSRRFVPRRRLRPRLLHGISLATRPGIRFAQNPFGFWCAHQALVRRRRCVRAGADRFRAPRRDAVRGKTVRASSSTNRYPLTRDSPVSRRITAVLPPPRGHQCSILSANVRHSVFMLSRRLPPWRVRR
jgi:hypothetical protein